MPRLLLSILPFFITSAIMAQSSIRMEITAVPSYHPTGSDIYIAGSFNGWNPADEHYKFRRDDKGNYQIDLQLAEGSYEYKLTRGGWDKAECKKGGASLPNRTLKIPAVQTVSLSIEDWVDRYPAIPKTSTASKNVHIIDTAFLIPQLKRTRRIWIYLPDNYQSDPQTRFPVLYMQDGQNLFDDLTAYAGEWGIDEYLDSVKAGKCIVVGIDHGGNKRLNEYNPYDNKHFGKGEGKKYISFLAKTLKPYIDKNYRTLTSPENTAIAGSSMGGLISMYAILKCPDVFGKAGVFSPSFAIGGKKIFEEINKKSAKMNGRIYFYAGKQEGDDMIPDLLRVVETITKKSKSITKAVIRDEGLHNEARWRIEFESFYEWIFLNKD